MDNVCVTEIMQPFDILETPITRIGQNTILRTRYDFRYFGKKSFQNFITYWVWVKENLYCYYGSHSKSLKFLTSTIIPEKIVNNQYIDPVADLKLNINK